MKQDGDRYTPDFLDKPRRGRPPKPDALTPAQRAKRYRDRKRLAREASPAIPLASWPLPWLKT